MFNSLCELLHRFPRPFFLLLIALTIVNLANFALNLERWLMSPVIVAPTHEERIEKFPGFLLGVCPAIEPEVDECGDLTPIFAQQLFDIQCEHFQASHGVSDSSACPARVTPSYQNFMGYRMRCEVLHIPSLTTASDGLEAWKVTATYHDTSGQCDDSGDGATVFVADEDYLDFLGENMLSHAESIQLAPTAHMKLGLGFRRTIFLNKTEDDDGDDRFFIINQDVAECEACQRWEEDANHYQVQVTIVNSFASFLVSVSEETYTYGISDFQAQVLIVFNLSLSIFAVFFPKKLLDSEGRKVESRRTWIWSGSRGSESATESTHE